MTIDLSISLQKHFGFSEFRPGQRQALEALLRGEHTLVVMPTGAGKSLIYQLAALHLPGLTLVISPLIALMKDQVDSLGRHKIPATFINSTIPASEQNARLRGVAEGKYRLVFVAPERFRSVAFLGALRSQKVSLLAVDEAHCISEWGHDFRPDYLRIAEARKSLNNPLTVALTATATPQVQADIIRLLGLPTQTARDGTARIVTGFNRPNLKLEVRYVSRPKSKLHALRELLIETKKGAVIIYTGTRREAEETSEFAREAARVPAEHYHAGLEANERERIQNDFMRGKLSVVAATNAFGMGIDRPDVRLVVHFNLPGSLEAYYQEAGRAGRDGLPARAVLLYAPDDRALQEWFIENSKTAPDELRRCYDAINLPEDSQAWLTHEELSRRTGMPEVKLKVALAELERAAVLEHLGDEGYGMLLRGGTWNLAAITAAIENGKQHIAHRKKQLDKMVAYAESNDCRRRILLDHFGDRSPVEVHDCCDNCCSQTPISSAVSVQPGKESTDGFSTSQVGLVILDTVRRLRTKVGREKLAQTLHGSHAADMRRFHYDQNAYYGRLTVFTQREIEALIEQLISSGYLKVIGGKYPVLNLTPGGEAAISIKAAIPLELPRSSSSQKTKRKKDESVTGGTRGITVQLLRRGLNPEQIANQRGLASYTIYNHLSQAIAAGEVEVDSVVPGEVRAQVEAAIHQVGSVESLTPLKLALPEEIGFGVIRCVVEAWKRCQVILPDISGPSAPVDELTDIILECVRVLPGKMPRSGVAKLLVGSKSERVEEYRTHPLYNRLAGHSRGDVMVQVDRLLATGRLFQDESAHLRLANCLSPGSEDSVEDFLNRSHPRALHGPWQEGWALGFHSSFSGADWSRSGVGELTYRLKYQGDLTVLPSLVEQAAMLIKEHPELAQVDAILPVPASTQRQVQPVNVFASALAEELNLPLLPAVVKTRQTEPQKEFHTRAQKRANVTGAFAVQEPISNLHLLVVDDLFDSGATLEEITRVLQRAGAASVCILTMTRTIHSDA